MTKYYAFETTYLVIYPVTILYTVYTIERNRTKILCVLKIPPCAMFKI